jgi:hypothetical protein
LKLTDIVSGPAKEWKNDLNVFFRPTPDGSRQVVQQTGWKNDLNGQGLDVIFLWEFS